MSVADADRDAGQRSRQGPPPVVGTQDERGVVTFAAQMRGEGEEGGIGGEEAALARTREPGKRKRDDANRESLQRGRAPWPGGDRDLQPELDQSFDRGPGKKHVAEMVGTKDDDLTEGSGVGGRGSGRGTREKCPSEV